jgi:hypothetical protein
MQVNMYIRFEYRIDSIQTVVEYSNSWTPMATPPLSHSAIHRHNTYYKLSLSLIETVFALEMF